MAELDIKGVAEAGKIVLTEFNSVLDRIAPMTEFKELAEKMNKEQAIYSRKTAKAVGDAAHAMLEAEVAYLSAMGPVLEWCAVVSGSYQFLANAGTWDMDRQAQFSEEKKTRLFVKTRKSLMIMCERGVTLITNGIVLLEAAETKLLAASQATASIIAQLNIDCDGKSDSYNELVENIRIKAYVSAIAGLLLGPFGLAISYGIAAGITETKVHDLLNKELPRVKSTYQSLKVKCESVAADLKANTVNIVVAKNDMQNLRGSTETAQDGLNLSDEFDEMKSAIHILKTACDSFSQKYNSKL